MKKYVFTFMVCITLLLTMTFNVSANASNIIVINSHNERLFINCDDDFNSKEVKEKKADLQMYWDAANDRDNLYHQQSQIVNATKKLKSYMVEYQSVLYSEPQAYDTVVKLYNELNQAKILDNCLNVRINFVDKDGYNLERYYNQSKERYTLFNLIKNNVNLDVYQDNKLLKLENKQFSNDMFIYSLGYQINNSNNIKTKLNIKPVVYKGKKLTFEILKTSKLKIDGLNNREIDYKVKVNGFTSNYDVDVFVDNFDNKDLASDLFLKQFSKKYPKRLILNINGDNLKVKNKVKLIVVGNGKDKNLVANGIVSTSDIKSVEIKPVIINLDNNAYQITFKKVEPGLFDYQIKKIKEVKNHQEIASNSLIATNDNSNVYLLTLMMIVSSLTIITLYNKRKAL